jgi:hypothetical protein
MHIFLTESESFPNRQSALLGNKNNEFIYDEAGEECSPGLPF